jgi:hypothetical protein
MGRFIAVLLAGTSVCLAGMHPVSAADMASSPVPAPYVPTPPPFSWTGFYLGANVGAGFGTTETSVDVGPALTALSGMPIAATAPLVSETFNGFIGASRLATIGSSASSSWA